MFCFGWVFCRCWDTLYLGAILDFTCGVCVLYCPGVGVGLIYGCLMIYLWGWLTVCWAVFYGFDFWYAEFLGAGF